jgi:hypothetical protein
MSDETCPMCGQPVIHHCSDEGTHCYLPPAPQLWLCRDDDGRVQLYSQRPKWDPADGYDGYWAGPGYADQMEGKSDGLDFLLPGQAVALHTGERLQGDNPHD